MGKIKETATAAETLTEKVNEAGNVMGKVC